jgi:zinc D-Ala-D-Ala dipeptidase
VAVAARSVLPGLAGAGLVLALAGGLADEATADQRPGVFRIAPRRPVAELRREALAAVPPLEAGPFRPVDLVELVTLDPTIRLDIRYATTENFLSTPVYQEARAFLQRPAAQALWRVHRSLKERVTAS